MVEKNAKFNEEEIQLRKRCVQLSAEGKNVTQIHRELNRTRDWVYKWLKRAQSGQSDWYLDQGRAPHHKPGKIGKCGFWWVQEYRLSGNGQIILYVPLGVH